MKTKTTIMKVLIPGFALAVLTACGGGGTDTDSPEYQAFMQRHSVMEELRDAILPLNQMEREEIPVDEGVFLESARTLAASAQIDRYRNFLVSVKNSKLQITNNKQITMTKIPNYKPV